MDTDKFGNDRVWALAFGVALVTMPAVTLILAFAVLSATQSAIVEQLTLLEILELYVVELVAFALFSYLLYRIARFTWAKHDDEMSETDTSESESPASIESANGDQSG